MLRKGRPRKNRPRKPSGRLRNPRKERIPIWTRVRDFGVTASQSSSPFSGYLAGVLFLRGRISATHLGKFYSFLQIAPRRSVRAIPLSVKINNGFKRDGSLRMSQRYFDLAKLLGSGIDALHALDRDQLIVPVNTIKRLIDKVPLTRSGYQFINWCENHHPKIPSRKRGREIKRR